MSGGNGHRGGLLALPLSPVGTGCVFWQQKQCWQCLNPHSVTRGHRGATACVFWILTQPPDIEQDLLALRAPCGNRSNVWKRFDPHSVARQLATEAMLGVPRSALSQQRTYKRDLLALLVSSANRSSPLSQQRVQRSQQHMFCSNAHAAYVFWQEKQCLEVPGTVLLPCSELGKDTPNSPTRPVAAPLSHNRALLAIFILLVLAGAFGFVVA